MCFPIQRWCILGTALDIAHGYPILEFYGDHLEHIEPLLMANPHPKLLNADHRVKRVRMVLRRLTCPCDN